MRLIEPGEPCANMLALLRKPWGFTPQSLCHLCHGLCHNPPIPTRVGPSLALSFGHTQKAANPRKPRMDAAFLCRFVSLALYPYSFTLRNGMEEVIGSIPIRSTKHFQ